MKKIIAILMTMIILAVSVTGCGSSETTVESIKKSGKLTVATSPDFPPFESLDEDNNVVGIEIEIMEKVCDELGVELEVKQMDFDSVLPGVQSGKFTVGMSGISVTEERQKNALFTDAYCLAAQAIVVTDSSSITCKADLDGKNVSVQTGTTAENYCSSQGYTVKSFTANNDAELALTTGKVDAWVIDDLTAAEMVKTYNESHDDQLVILDEPMTTEPYAFALKKGNDELADAINEIIKKMLADGTIEAIFEKYDVPYTAPDSQN